MIKKEKLKCCEKSNVTVFNAIRQTPYSYYCASLRLYYEWFIQRLWQNKSFIVYVLYPTGCCDTLRKRRANPTSIRFPAVLSWFQISAADFTRCPFKKAAVPRVTNANTHSAEHDRWFPASRFPLRRRALPGIHVISPRSVRINEVPRCALRCAPASDASRKVLTIALPQCSACLRVYKQEQGEVEVFRAGRGQWMRARVRIACASRGEHYIQALLRLYFAEEQGRGKWKQKNFLNFNETCPIPPRRSLLR